MNKKELSFDVVVCGGGLAGLCAAISAARHGAKTCLIQDRPVLGGNSSSEVRVTTQGASTHHYYARETGVISELLIEERAINHEPMIENGWTNSLWDLVQYDLVQRTPGLTLFLNTSVTGAQKTGRDAVRVTARVANAETELSVSGKFFIDATGDALVADALGCEWRMGAESREQTGETHAFPQAGKDTMGSSLLFKAKDMGRPVAFTPPDWAILHDDPDFFYKQGRVPWDLRGGYWWIEIGMPWHTIHDNETIRHELTRHLLGIWDFIKNRDPKLKLQAANLALDWVGQVPGKRESRRVMGRTLMTEHDIQKLVRFPDEVAYGGWFIDLHTPGGLLAATSEANAAQGWSETAESARAGHVGPYGIPLRILISKDVDNLLMAGRDVSVTRAALGTVRVMATCALMGQAAGTAAALALRKGVNAGEIADRHSTELQQILLRDGVFLPSASNQDPADLARLAAASASSTARLGGLDPEERTRYEEMRPWEESLAAAREKRPALERRRGQFVAVGGEALDSIAMLLGNDSGTTQNVTAVLSEAEHLWDYRVEGMHELARTTLAVPPGPRQWVEWPLKFAAGWNVHPGRFLRLDLLANPKVLWHEAAASLPGHCSVYEAWPGKMRRQPSEVTQCFRISPGQSCWEPRQVLSGVTRPHRATNLWLSDPAQPLPQWLELAWKKPVLLGSVELTFPGHLRNGYDHEPPQYRAPECARDYRLSAMVGGRWIDVAVVEGNYQRRRVHRLAEAVSADRLRVTITATHGCPSAGLYEIRCYGPE